MLAGMHRTLARARLVGAAVTILALAGPATASAGVLDSLRGWWPMWEGRGQLVNDWSGHGHAGQLGSTGGVDDNDPTWIRSGFLGLIPALRFDGDDFVRIPDSNDLEPERVTVAAWVRATQSPGTFRYIVGKGADNCSGSSYALGTFNHGGIGFIAYHNGNWVRTWQVYPDLVWDGKWHFVAGTYDGTTARLFLDGKSMGDSAPGGAIDYGLPTTGDTGIGGYLGTCDLYYTGDVAQVSVFADALPVDRLWSSLTALLPKPAR